MPQQGPFLGRRQELAELEAAAEAARSGVGQFVFVGGEAGIGKSRLVAEFASHITDAGGLAVFGAAPILLGAEVPFAPVAAALRDLRRQLSEAELVDLLPSSAEISRLLPEVSPRGIATDVDPLSQVRLFEQAVGVFERLGEMRAGAPALVVIEDLQWADGSSRDLLAYAMGNGIRGRVVVIATYRAGDVAAGHPLRRLLAETVRSPQIHHVELGPLEEAETRALVTSAALQTMPPAVSDAVISRSGGNPLYAELLVAAAASGALPTSLVNLLRSRFAELPPELQQLLRLAAAAGVRMPAVLLDRAAAGIGLDPAELVKQAIGAGLLEFVSARDRDLYAFRQPLMQEVIYSDTVPAERTRAHFVLGSVLAQSPDLHTDALAVSVELARHWWATGDRAQAFPYLVTAAGAAEAVFAFAEAHALYERALVARASVGGARPAPPKLIGFRPPDVGAGAEHPSVSDDRALPLLAARAASLAGRPARALELIETLSDDRPDGELLAARAQYLWESGRRSDSLAAFEAAVDALPGIEPERRPRILRAAARALLLAARYDDAKRLAAQAAMHAKSAGDDQGRRQAEQIMAAAMARSGEVERAVDLIESASLAEVSQLRSSYANPRVSRIGDVLAGYWGQAAAYSRAGEPERAVDAAMRGLRRADHLGAAAGWRDLVGVAALEQLLDLGRWDEAEALVGDLLGRTPGRGSPEVEAQAAYLNALRGRTTDGLENLRRAREGATNAADGGTSFLLARAAAELAIAGGQFDDAASALAGALAVAGANADAGTQLELVALALRVTAEQAQLARARRVSAAVAELEAVAETLYGRAVALAQTNRGSAGPKVEVALRLARAEYDRALDRSSADDWAAVARSWTELRQPYATAYAQLRLAERALAARSTQQAAAALRDAYAVAQRLGAEPLRRLIDELAHRARIELDSSTTEATPDSAASNAEAATQRRASDEEANLGLSAREVEVLALIADGRSNRQIAEALFVTEKTAGHHVSNILRKLGVASRVEAAAVGLRAGIVGGRAPVAEQIVEASASADNPSPDRRPACLMFTDIVSSTALLDAIGDEAWVSLIKWHDEVLRSLFAAYAGREIDHAGDGFFVIFSDAVAGLDCAIAIQRALLEHRRRSGFAPRLRIAVHVAEVIVRGGQVHGRGVHVAARIVDGAAADEILVSADSLPDTGTRYVRLEPRQMYADGLNEPIAVIPIEWRTAGA